MSNSPEKKGMGAIDFFCIGFGAIVGVGAHVEGQIFESKTYASGDVTCIILTPPFAYNGIKYQSDEKFFYNAKDEIARAYELHVGDIYTISAAGLSGDPKVGAHVDATNKASTTAGTGFDGVIIEEVAYGNGSAYRILVKAL